MENIAQYWKDDKLAKKDSLKRFFIRIAKGSMLTLSIFLLFSNGRIFTLAAKAADNIPVLETKKRNWLEYIREKSLSLFQSARSMSVSDFSLFLGAASTVAFLGLLFISKSILEDSQAKDNLINILRRSLELCIKNSEPDPFN
jgi:hypothetical protein